MKFRAKSESTDGLLLCEPDNRDWEIRKRREIPDRMSFETSTKEMREVAQGFAQVGQRVLIFNVPCLERNVRSAVKILPAIDNSTERQDIQT